MSDIENHLLRDEYDQAFAPIKWSTPELPDGAKKEEKPSEVIARLRKVGGFKNPDMVNHPPHYQSDNGIECIDAIRAALGKEGFIAYCRGNVIKYSWRLKNNPAEDQGKAAWYANKAKEALEE